MAFIKVALALALPGCSWLLFCVACSLQRVAVATAYRINHGNFGGALVRAAGQNNSIAVADKNYAQFYLIYILTLDNQKKTTKTKTSKKF